MGPFQRGGGRGGSGRWGHGERAQGEASRVDLWLWGEDTVSGSPRPPRRHDSQGRLAGLSAQARSWLRFIMREGHKVQSAEGKEDPGVAGLQSLP